MKSFIDRFMVHRLFIGVSNLCLVLAGLYIIDFETATTAKEVEIREIPREAALPFKSLTRAEKTKQFFVDLQIDTSHLKPKHVHQSLDPWESYIDHYAGQYSVDPDLVSAIVYAESKGDPFRISRDGALGLMQIMPSTASFLGFENVLDPEENIKAGVKYIAWLLKRYGESHALWAWNAGPTRVTKKFMPRETRHFIVEVLSVKSLLKENKGQDGLI